MQRMKKFVFCIFSFKNLKKALKENTFPQKLAAYSLVEVAIALIIIGIISGSGLLLLSTKNIHQKNTITQKRQEQISKALAGYALRYDRLPYAANPSARSDSFGKEARLNVGIVPFKELWLPEEMARDGYGRFLTYKVGSPAPVDDADPEGQSYCNEVYERQILLRERTSEGDLRPYARHPSDSDLEDEDESSSNLDQIAFVLISHGEKGYGAFEGSPGRVHKNLRTPHGEDEAINSSDELEAVIAPPSGVGSQQYDDIVYFQTRGNLMSLHGRACVSNGFLNRLRENNLQAPPQHSAASRLPQETIASL